ncbi:hypothetical protein [Clostridium sp.]|jgi:uncharacterized Zn finger protein|uniref:hypothetical protein n=1 Tax=Clostridium sp. TaxID=1506 RepID=UPI003EE9EE30
MIMKCNKCKQYLGAIGNKTIFCKNCGKLLTESLFANKDEIKKIAIDQMPGTSDKISINIEIETDKNNKIVNICYPDLKFFLGKILELT